MNLKTWWAQVPNKEKSGVVVLAAIVSILILIGAGIQLGNFLYS